MIKISHFNILLVEDEILLMQSLARHVEELDMGFRVVCQTANGQDALKRLEKETSIWSSLISACRSWTVWSLPRRSI